MELKQHEKRITVLVPGTSTFSSAMLGFCQQMTALFFIVFQLQVTPMISSCMREKNQISFSKKLN